MLRLLLAVDLEGQGGRYNHTGVIVLDDKLDRGAELGGEVARATS